MDVLKKQRINEANIWEIKIHVSIFIARMWDLFVCGDKVWFWNEK